MWERFLTYCTLIRRHVPYVFGVLVVSRTLVIRSSGSWPSLFPLRSFLTLLRSYWLLFCFVSHSSYEPFAQPNSSPLNSSPPLDLSTLLLVKEKVTCRLSTGPASCVHIWAGLSGCHLLLSLQSTLHLLDIKQFSLCLVKIFMICQFPSHFLLHS